MKFTKGMNKEKNISAIVGITAKIANIRALRLRINRSIPPMIMAGEGDNKSNSENISSLIMLLEIEMIFRNKKKTTIGKGTISNEIIPKGNPFLAEGTSRFVFIIHSL
jgi:hypothetical protein